MGERNYHRSERIQGPSPQEAAKQARKVKLHAAEGTPEWTRIEEEIKKSNVWLNEVFSKSQIFTDWLNEVNVSQSHGCDAFNGHLPLNFFPFSTTFPLHSTTSTTFSRMVIRTVSAGWRLKTEDEVDASLARVRRVIRVVLSLQAESSRIQM